LAHDQHRATSWESYLGAHIGKLHDFEDHFLIANELDYELLPEHVHWLGRLRCRGGIEIHVERLQRSFFKKGLRWVETVEYKYQVIQRRADQTIELVRYDNQHTQPGHPDAHHRHRFDEFGVEIEPPEHVGRGGWPNLGKVLDEAHAYWRGQDEA
jgi:hypothetical protein